MSQAKYFNEITQQWEPLAIGGQGPQGEAGPGVPEGGIEGQILVKTDETDFNTQWADNSAESTFYLVRNNTGSTILKGTLVSATGAEPSGRVDVGPFESTGLQDSELRVMGVATSNISNGSNGTVMTFGALKNIDTRGTASSAIAVGDETWAEGDILYAHPTVAGKLTNVRPQHDLAIAFITVRHQSSGQIAVRIIPSNSHLEWLHDVEIDTAAAGDLIVRNSANTLWENATPAEAGLSEIGHDHDDLYYGKTETDTLLSGKANASHNHSASEITSGQLNSNIMPSGSVLQVKTVRYQGRPTFGFSNSDVIIGYLNVAITPKSPNSILIAQYQISGEATYNAVFRAYRDNNLITTSGYEGYNTEDGNTWSGIAVWPYDTDLASTPNTQFMQYFVPSGSTSPTTLQISIRSSANESQTFYMNRSVSSGGGTAFEIMVSSVVVWEVLL